MQFLFLRQRPDLVALALSCTLVLAACSDEAEPVALGPCGLVDPADGFVVHDRDGVRVVENLRPASDGEDAPAVDPEPLVTIGARESDPDDVIGSLASAVFLSDQRIVVADGLNLQIRVHAPDGALLHRFGGEGDGPGEFMRSVELFRGAGDTLVVAHYVNRRFARMLPDGTYLDGGWVSGEPGSGQSHGLSATFGDGRFLVFDVGMASGPSEPATQVTRPERTYHALDPATGALEEIGPVPGNEHFTFVHEGELEGVLTFGDLPYGRIESWAVGQEAFFVGMGDDFEVERHVPGAGLQGLYRICRERSPVDPAELERLIEERLAPLSPDAQSRERPALEAISKPTTEPAHLEMHVDATGRLWVRDFAPPWAEQPWQVFDDEGRWLGTTMLPAGLRILDIAADHLLAAHEGELGEETVRLLALR